MHLYKSVDAEPLKDKWDGTLLAGCTSPNLSLCTAMTRYESTPVTLLRKLNQIKHKLNHAPVITGIISNQKSKNKNLKLRAYN